MNDFQLVEQDGVRAVEGTPGEACLTTAADAARVLEACFSNHARVALLYAENLPAGFFDLSSGEAGAILQRLRNYGVRLAVVCPPGSVRYSSRFGEMVAEERRGHSFGLFETRQAAWDWLSRQIGRSQSTRRAGAGFSGFGRLQTYLDRPPPEDLARTSAEGAANLSLEGRTMAYGVVHQFPGGTRQQYEASIAAVHPGRDQLPAGQLFHAAGPSAGGWTIIAIHDSKESWERFRDGILMPRMQQGIKGGFSSPPHETLFEVHNLKK